MKLNDVYKANDLLLRLRQAETWLSSIRGVDAKLVLPARSGIGIDSTAVSIDVSTEVAADLIRKLIVSIKEELRALGVEVP